MTLAAVHLVWSPYGPALLEEFVAAYRARRAGVDHDLVLLFNGFDGAEALEPFRALTGGLGAREIVLDAPHQDLAAYRHAARVLEHDRLCFLNSFSRPLADDWLAALSAPLDDPAVGAAGATGSWASTLDYGRWQAGLGGAYGAVYERRRPVAEAIHLANDAVCPDPLRLWAFTTIDLLRNRPTGSPFPAVHLRTNSFVMRREEFARLADQPLETKRHTYLLESGRRSLTTKLRALGRDPVVVDRAGTAWPVARWPEARVFWQGDQEGLLVSDNQSRLFDAAAEDGREALRRYAWGLRALPPSA